jgi:hypothetical protein
MTLQAPGFSQEILESFTFFEITSAGVVREMSDGDDPRKPRQGKGDIVVMPPEQVRCC